MKPRIIVWAGGSVVYEGCDDVEAMEIEDKYKQQGYDDVVREVVA